MTVSSLRDITGRGVTEASPRDSDDGLTSTISRIREGVLLFGGRLGFRILSKVLGVACKEHNIVGIRRQDLFHSICLMGATIQPGELDVIFKKFDHNGNGVIIAQDLLRELRGGMPPTRLNAVITAFQQLIIEGGGSVDYGDMLNLFQFNAACHPDVEDGIVSREEVIFDFINCWPGMNAASSVTTDMFVAYYTDISPASESDERFVAVVQRSWKIPETDAYKTVKSNRSVTVIRLDGTSTVVQLPASLVLDATDQATVRNFLTRSGVRDIKEVRLSM
uniref:Uncharacterized protein TCIL3000_11_9860 n=1 Tax=Trypanosoma congolense (strain IL3000) TaxID=1068625 RepID=G0V1J8_TRYCI|nr:unnamed protein product [Trypanosoma congolense IL3000]